MKVFRKLESDLLTYLECRTCVEQHNALQCDVYDEVSSSSEYYEVKIDWSELFNHIGGIKVQMDAINLTPAGSKIMALVQKNPIFTVECRLSNELIDQVPRYDMFNVMQFECDQFNKDKQYASFDQTCVRQVGLSISLNKETKAEPNLGRLHFTVWWRESGTCLNEMLGMSTLNLTEFYKLSTLNQYKRIVISRRDLSLAYLYLKISILIDVQHLESNPKLLYKSVFNLQQWSQQHKQQCMKKAAEESESKPASHKGINNLTTKTAQLPNNADKYSINSGKCAMPFPVWYLI